MRVGSVEYVVIAFPGNQFNGQIVPALRELVEKGLVNIIDLAFVMKDAEGETLAVELSDMPPSIASAFDGWDHEEQGLLNEDDLQRIADDLEPNSSAGLIVWENAWSARFAAAVRDSGGILIAHDKIPADVVEAALDYLASGAA